MRLLAIAAAAILTASNVSAQQKNGDADQAAIAGIRTAYQAAAGTQDGAALARLHAPDGVEMPPNAPAARGRVAIEAFHKGFGQQWMMHGITITSTETRVSGDTAYDIGTYKQGLMSQKGGRMIDDKGKYVVLLKKDGSGKWWITHSIYNSDLPAPGGTPAK